MFNFIDNTSHIMSLFYKTSNAKVTFARLTDCDSFGINPVDNVLRDHLDIVISSSSVVCWLKKETITLGVSCCFCCCWDGRVFGSNVYPFNGGKRTRGPAAVPGSQVVRCRLFSWKSCCFAGHFSSAIIVIHCIHEEH